MTASSPVRQRGVTSPVRERGVSNEKIGKPVKTGDRGLIGLVAIFDSSNFIFQPTPRWRTGLDAAARYHWLKSKIASGETLNLAGAARAVFSMMRLMPRFMTNGLSDARSTVKTPLKTNSHKHQKETHMQSEEKDPTPNTEPIIDDPSNEIGEPIKPPTVPSDPADPPGSGGGGVIPEADPPGGGGGGRLLSPDPWDDPPGDGGG